MEPRRARNGRADPRGRPRRAEDEPAARARRGPERAGGSQQQLDEQSETGVLLDALIHDLRTPLSAMSGWLEVLEAHFGETDGIVARALLGLRRGVEGQTQTLNGISDVLTKQRVELPDEESGLLGQLQHALAAMDGRPDSPLDPAELARLAPLRTFAGASNLACPGGAATLGEACGTLLHAVAVAQGEGDGSISIEAEDEEIRIRVPGANGDLSPLDGLVNGLRPHAPRRPHIRPQALWLARSIFRRCKLRLALAHAAEGGVVLLIGREGEGAGSPGRASAS